MKMQIQRLFAAVVVLTSWLPLPATAEMRGAAACASPSWNALMSGECTARDANIALQPRHGGADDSTQLVIEPVSDVPEPATYALMFVGLVAVIVATRRRRRD